MRVKAKLNFSGALTMCAGEILDVTEQGLVSDLIQADYVELVKEKPTEKKPTEKNQASRKAKK